jgi:hypothetical protein
VTSGLLYINKALLSKNMIAVAAVHNKFNLFFPRKYSVTPRLTEGISQGYARRIFEERLFLQGALTFRSARAFGIHMEAVQALKVGAATGQDSADASKGRRTL